MAWDVWGSWGEAMGACVYSRGERRVRVLFGAEEHRTSPERARVELVSVFLHTRFVTGLVCYLRFCHSIVDFFTSTVTHSLEVS